MEYITAANNYIVVDPSGDIRGFVELSDARNYTSCYYLDNILEYRPRDVNNSKMFDVYLEEDQEALNYITGVNEGECRIFDLDSVIERVREDSYFQEEKDEIISKLLKENINLNIYDYGIDNIFVDVKQLYSV